MSPPNRAISRTRDSESRVRDYSTPRAISSRAGTHRNELPPMAIVTDYLFQLIAKTTIMKLSVKLSA